MIILDLIDEGIALVHIEVPTILVDVMGRESDTIQN